MGQSLQLLHADGDMSWVVRGKRIVIHLSQEKFIERMAQPHTLQYQLKSLCVEALDDAEMTAYELLAKSEKNTIIDNQDVLAAFDTLWEVA